MKLRQSYFSYKFFGTLLLLSLGIASAFASRPLGMDVSSYQDSITWSSMPGQGIFFAWTKATQGNFYIDAYYSANISGGKAAGIYMGSYDYCQPNDLTPAQEATYFWSTAGSSIKADGLTMMPMLDFEVFSGYDGASGYGDWADQWCTNVVGFAQSKGVTIKPFIYISSCNAGYLSGADVSAWFSDLANYNGESSQTGTPWNECTSDESFGPGVWTVWQYDDTASYSGFSGQEPDVDVFNGTTNQFLASCVATGATAPSGSTLYWDPSAKKASPGSGGRGNWDLSTSDWWWAGNSNVVWSSANESAVFSGTAGVVTLNATVGVTSITFATNGYSFASSTNALSFSSPASIIFQRTITNVIPMGCALSSGTGLLVTGGGNLLLSATNSIVGASVINSNSTVQLAGSWAWGTRAASFTLSNAAALQNNDQKAADVFLGSSFQITLGTGGGILNDSTNAYLVFAGAINGAGSLTKTGVGGTLVLGAGETYSGSTIISQGTLALNSSGSISSSTNITIMPGAVFDVSSNATYTFAAGASLTASGTTSTAAIKGGTSLVLNSQPITLNYDGSHPALTISHGTLSLGSNAITVNGAALAPGSYTLIQQTSGNITSTGSNAISGTAIPTNAAAGVAVSGGTVVLTIADLTAIALNTLSNSVFGQPVTLTATVTPAVTNGTVQFYDNGTPLGGSVSVTNGAASFTTNGLPAGSHSITASFGGATGYLASTTTSATTFQVTLPPNNSPVTISGTAVVGNGAFQMSFSGVAGYTYIVESTTNLDSPITWTPLHTNTADTNGNFSFTDQNASNYSSQFYQTQVQQ